MAIAERYAEVEWSGDAQSGSGTLTGESGAFGALPVSSPSRMGPPDGKTTPEELLASAHAGCYVIALAFFVTEAGSTVDGLKVRVRYTLDMVDGAFKITKADLEVSGSVTGIDAETFDTLARSAEQMCPVSNAVRGNVEISLTTQLDG